MTDLSGLSNDQLRAMYQQQGGVAPPAAPAPVAPQAAPATAGSPPLADPADDTLADGVYTNKNTGETFGVATIGGTGSSGAAPPSGANVQSAVGAAVSGVPSVAAQPAPTPAATPVPSSASAIAAPDLTKMSDADLLAAFKAQGGALPSAANDDGTSLLGKAFPQADAALHQFAEGVTGGWVDKARAGLDSIPAMLRGGLPAASATYNADLDNLRGVDAQQHQQFPVTAGVGSVAGMLAQGALLPGAEAAGIGARVATGAAQGAVLGGINSLGQSRDGVIQALPQAALDAGAGAVLGGAFGGVFGPRLPPTAAKPIASLEDFDRVGVQPMLATNGPESAQRVGQILHGTPLAGIPIQQAAKAQVNQAGNAFSRVLGNYGAAGTPEEAGAILTSANQRSAQAVADQQGSVASGIQGLSASYGSDAGRRATGDAVQDAVGRFSQGDGVAGATAGSVPARATSFADKANALYGAAFDRLDGEMAGKTGTPAVADPTAGATVTINGQKTPLSSLPQSMRDAISGAPSAPTVAPAKSMMDQALNTIRSGKPIKPNTGPSLLDFVAKSGGLNDQGGEVSAMDGDLWHRNLSHVGNSAFRSKLIKPTGSGLEEMAERAHAAGYFPDVPDATMDGSQNMQPVTGQHLLDAMQGELAGNPRYAQIDDQAAELSGHVQDAQELIDHLGLDPKTQSNGEMKSAIDGYMGVKSTPAAEPTSLPGQPPMAPISSAATPSGSPSQITAPATQATLKSMLERNQSPQVRALLLQPEVKRVASAVGDTSNMSFQDLRDLRTWTREAQDDPKLRQNIGGANLQRLEGSLTEDIYDNADRLGSPGAAKQLRRADQFYAAGSRRINGALGTFYKSASGENAFDKVLSSAQGGGGANIGRLQALQRSLRPDEWGNVAAGVINHMGATPDGFDLGKFIGQYDKLSPDGAQTLFGGRNAALHGQLSHLVEQGRTALADKGVTHFSNDPAAAVQGLLAAAKEGGSKASVSSIEGARSAIPAAQWGDVAASGLRHMGIRPGGEHFDFSHFSTEWGRLSQGGKEAIYGGPGREKDLAALDSLARISNQFKAASKFYNHSNSGHAGGGILAAIEAGRAVMEGNHEELLGLAAAGTVGAGLSKILASPGAARLVLRSVRAATPEAADVADRGLAGYATRNPLVAHQINSLRTALRHVRVNAPGTLAAGTVHLARSQLSPQQ